MIKAGVTIGSGAIVGAGALVTKDVEPYTVVAGIPAKVIKKRFPDQIARRLLDSQWWEIDAEKLISLSKYFGDPIFFLEVLENRQDDKPNR